MFLSASFNAGTSKEAGMTVALPQGAMRWSELVIMYLATAAPFGVARFFAAGRGRRGARALATACASALLWPRAAFALLRRRSLAAGEGPRARGTLDERRIEQAERAVVGALLSVEDILEAECGPLGGAERYAMFAARSSVGRYAGLALACAAPVDEAEPRPTARETELCRVAGRTGEDLRTAGRCVRRRNAALLSAHRERARDELVHALAAAGEAAHKTVAARPKAEDGGGPARTISESLLGAYARAVELLSLFDDRGAVVSAARLMDAECARLRRLEERAADAQEGVGRCTTHAAQGAFATTLRSTTT